MVVSVILAASCGGDNDRETVASTSTTVTSRVATTPSVISSTSTTHAPSTTRSRPTTPTLPSDPEVLVRIGETARAGDIELTVTALRFDPCAGTDYQALPGNTFAVVTAEFTMTRITGDTGFLGPLTWSLQDNDGQTYTGVASCHDAESDEAWLEPGSTVVRVISFEIPGGAQGLQFTYEGGDDTDGQTVIVDLGE